MFNIKSVILLSLVVLSFPSYSQSEVAANPKSVKGYNPFAKPKPIIRKKVDKKADEKEEKSIDINLVAGMINNNQRPQFKDPLASNPYINAGLVYKGTVNGVDIFYDESTKRYIKDESRVLNMDDTPSNPPSLESVNY